MGLVVEYYIISNKILNISDQLNLQFKIVNENQKHKLEVYVTLFCATKTAYKAK